MHSRFLIFILLLTFFSSCKEEDVIEDLSCDKVLFGIPNESTGLTAEECLSVCTCKGYTPREFTSSDLEELKTWELTEPLEELTSNPYNDDVPPTEEGICAIIIDDLADKKYHIQTFSNQAEAENAGAIVTHAGPCGLCSTLQDLVVYLEFRDLGTTVRQCGIENLLGSIGDITACIQVIGFTTPCAQIWAYNSVNTRTECFSPCIEAVLSEVLFNVIIPYNNPDGSLSPCIGCDEEISGPIFKAFAGRTRRNSGIPSGICRICEGVAPIAHNYPM